MSLYLDHNATTPVDPRVRDAMLPALASLFGNPSSVHAVGRSARDAVERARAAVAGCIGAATEQLVFTSGGTESNQLGVIGGALAMRAKDPARVRILSARVEHPSVTAQMAVLAAQGFSIAWLPVDRAGRVIADALFAALDSTVALVAMQLANSETGVLQDVAAFAARARAHGVWLHCDAVQALGKIAFDARALGVDSASLSAHKIFGPKGVGALYLGAGRAPVPLAHGGHQERERRPGTENVAGVIGMAAAATFCVPDMRAGETQTRALQTQLEAGLSALGGEIAGAARLPNTTNVRFAGVPGDMLLQALDIEGICVSTGSACSSGSLAPSPVLLAMGVPANEAKEAVRISLGHANTTADVDRVLATLPRIIERIRAAM